VHTTACFTVSFCYCHLERHFTRDFTRDSNFLNSNQGKIYFLTKYVVLNTVPPVFVFYFTSFVFVFFSRIWSMILRLNTSEKSSMEKQGNLFKAGTTFSQRDTFRES